MPQQCKKMKRGTPDNLLSSFLGVQPFQNVHPRSPVFPNLQPPMLLGSLFGWAQAASRPPPASGLRHSAGGQPDGVGGPSLSAWGAGPPFPFIRNLFEGRRVTSFYTTTEWIVDSYGFGAHWSVCSAPQQDPATHCLPFELKQCPCQPAPSGLLARTQANPPKAPDPERLKALRRSNKAFTIGRWWGPHGPSWFSLPAWFRALPTCFKPPRLGPGKGGG